MTSTLTPHECFFRENFVRPTIARDFLRHTLPHVLLADLVLERLVIFLPMSVTTRPGWTFSNTCCAPMSKTLGGLMKHRSVASTNKPYPESL